MKNAKNPRAIFLVKMQKNILKPIVNTKKM